MHITKIGDFLGKYYNRFILFFNGSLVALKIPGHAQWVAAVPIAGEQTPPDLRPGKSGVISCQIPKHLQLCKEIEQLRKEGDIPGPNAISKAPFNIVSYCSTFSPRMFLLDIYISSTRIQNLWSNARFIWYFPVKHQWVVPPQNNIVGKPF